MRSGAGHITSLDGLRGLAALVVLVSHLSNETGLLGGVLGAGAGQLGVMLFFALSGFLMAHVTWDTPPTVAALRRFAVHRMSRVLPLFYVAVLAAFVAPAPFAIDTLTDLLAHMSLVRGDRVFWTVPVEIGFYMIFPVLWLLRDRAPMLLSVGALGLLALGVALRAVTQPSPVQLLGVGWFLPAFALGVLACLAQRRELRLPCPDLVLAAGGVLLLLAYPRASQALFGITTSAWDRPGVLLLMPVLLLAAVQAPLGGRVLGAAPARWVGKVSYSLYLWHLFVMAGIARLTGWAETAPWAYAAAVLVLSGLAAEASYRLIEAPSRRWLNARLAEPRAATPRGSGFAAAARLG